MLREEEYLRMNVAMCIPTYNRANVVEDTLSRGVENYRKFGIDVYYYDSSDDDSTKLVVQKYIDKGYSNIYYIKVQNGESKHAMFYSGMGLNKKYEYIWPVNDRVWFEEPTLKAIDDAMNEKMDAIFLGVLWCFSNPSVGTKVYEDPKEFYLDWGYLVTSLDVNIFRYDSMVDGLTYEEIKDYNISYQHFQLMFHQLAKGSKRVKALVGNGIIAYNSKLVTSGWKKNVFETWIDRWIDVNEKLPEIYDKYKEIVIKQAGTLPWIFGELSYILEYKKCGALTMENVEKVLKQWDRVSNISKEKVRAIADGTYDCRHDLDLIPVSKDELLKLLVDMINYIKSGRMPKDRIPYDDVFQATMNKVVKKLNGDRNSINIIAGSVEDIILFIRDKEPNVDEICKALQLLISIIMLSL